VLYATPGLDGLSSLSYSLAAEAVGESAVVALSVSGTTLAMIFAEYLPHTIHFLKVDVEGAEREVLAGNDWDRWRPSIVIVESTVPRSQRRSNEAWRGILEARGYRRAYFDGLNDFYLSAESLELLEHFSIPVNFFDDVQPFSRFGNVFDDQRHPDFGWARALAARFLAAGAVLGPSTDFKVLPAYPPSSASFSIVYGRGTVRTPAQVRRGIMAARSYLRLKRYWYSAR